jgi:hypothetical protein
MTDKKSLPIIDAGYRLAMEINQTRQSFAWHMEDHLLDLSDVLLALTYVPRQATIGYHSTSSGKKIPVPCIEDRLVLRALKQVLLPLLERSFIYDTYAGIRICSKTYGFLSR